MIVRLLLAATMGLVAALWTWTLPVDPTLRTRPGDPAGVTVHVLNNGFHTDLAVPRAELERGGGPLALASRSLGAGDWVLVGWGDATFFVDQSPMEGRMLDGARAFFMPGNASVVMLDPETGDPALRFPQERRRSLTLSPRAFSALTAHIEGTLKLDRGQAHVSTARPDDEAHFFDGRESFWIGYLCNNWMARTLNAAGVPMRPMRAATAGEVIAALDRAAAKEAAALDTAGPDA